MCWVSKLRHQHGRCSVFEAQAQTDDGAGHSEHDQPVCERLQEDADDDDHGADDNRVLPTDFLDEPP